MERIDDYQKRREKVKSFSDEELKNHFWELLHKIIEPIVEEAKTHTSPSIERSVLLRMGFSSIEGKALVTEISERGLLGHGAGGIIYRIAKKNGIDVRDAGLGLLEGKYWEDINP
jgi:D-ornithine 4,5-aminomutase subunit alpha